MMLHRDDGGAGRPEATRAGEAWAARLSEADRAFVLRCAYNRRPLRQVAAWVLGALALVAIGTATNGGVPRFDLFLLAAGGVGLHSFLRQRAHRFLESEAGARFVEDALVLRRGPLARLEVE